MAETPLGTVEIGEYKWSLRRAWIIPNYHYWLVRKDESTGKEIFETVYKGRPDSRHIAQWADKNGRILLTTVYTHMSYLDDQAKYAERDAYNRDQQQQQKHQARQMYAGRNLSRSRKGR